MEPSNPSESKIPDTKKMNQVNGHLLHKKLQRFVKILLIVAVLWFIIDNLDFFPIFQVTLSDDEVKSGDFQISKNVDIRPLQTELISVEKSFDRSSMTIEVKNIDNVPGNITVVVECTSPASITDKKVLTNPGEIKEIEFTGLQGICDDYYIQSETIRIESDYSPK